MTKTWLALLAGAVIGIGIGIGIAIGLGMHSEVRGGVPAAADGVELPARASNGSSGEPALRPPTTLDPSARGEVHDSVVPEVDDTTVARTLDRMPIMPPGERPRGSGEIWGRVLDPEGGGLAGVTIVATVFEGYAMRSTEDYGRDAPSPSLEDVMREAAERHLELQSLRYRASTDADGSYRLTGLPPREFRLEGFKDGYVVRPRNERLWTAQPGTAIDFAAARVTEVLVRVRSADGSVPERAVVNVRRAGAADPRPFQRVAWSPPATRVRLEASAVELRAFAGTGSGTQRSNELAPLQSDAVALDLAQAGAREVELVLRGRPGIRGRVRFPREEPLTLRSESFLRLAAIPEGEEVDLLLLARSDRSERVDGVGEFAFMDLEPGRYAVGVTRIWQGPVVAHAVVDVESTVVECELDVPAFDARDFLAAAVTGPDGEPVEGTRFSFAHAEPDGSASTGAGRGLYAGEGLHYVAIPVESRRRYFEDPKPGHSFELIARHESLGSATVPLEPGQSEVDIAFNAPARLDVQLQGYAGSEHVGRIALRLVRGGSRLRYAARRHEQGVGASGSVVFEGVAPGDYQLVASYRDLQSPRRQEVELLNTPVHLAPGDNAVRVGLPGIYSFRVEVPGGEPTSRVFLVREIDDRRETIHVERCDADGWAAFDVVPEGEYMLSVDGPGRQGHMRIRVPTGDVLYRADSR